MISANDTLKNQKAPRTRCTKQALRTVQKSSHIASGAKLQPSSNRCAESLCRIAVSSRSVEPLESGSVPFARSAIHFAEPARHTRDPHGRPWFKRRELRNGADSLRTN
jgi:hypothetical protein